MRYFFLLLLVLAGCMTPDAKRLIPENKDANIYVVSPAYGMIIIQTRVAAGTNSLPPLSTNLPAVSLR